MQLVGVDGDRVAVAGGAAAAFDRRVQRHGVRPGVALVGVEKRRRILRLRPGDRDERDADRPAVPRARAEVGMEAGAGADRGHHRRGIRQHRQLSTGVFQMLSAGSTAQPPMRCCASASFAHNRPMTNSRDVAHADRRTIVARFIDDSCRRTPATSQDRKRYTAREITVRQGTEKRRRSARLTPFDGRLRTCPPPLAGDSGRALARQAPSARR